VHIRHFVLIHFVFLLQGDTTDSEAELESESIRLTARQIALRDGEEEQGLVALPMGPPKSKKTGTAETEYQLQRRMDQAERRRQQAESEKELIVERLLQKTSASQNKRDQKQRLTGGNETRYLTTPTQLLLKIGGAGETLSFPATGPLPLELFSSTTEHFSALTIGPKRCSNQACSQPKSCSIRVGAQVVPVCGSLLCVRLLQSSAMS